MKGGENSQQLVGLTGLLKRRPSCGYCLFEHILPDEFRQPEVLIQPLPPIHVKRLVIEELCSCEDGGDVDCHMKYAAMHYFENDRMALQWDCVEMFKNDEGVEWAEALMRWTSTQLNGVNYAQRFSQVYSMGGEHLTTKGIHDIVVSDKRTYNSFISLAARLNRERMERVRTREERGKI